MIGTPQACVFSESYKKIGLVVPEYTSTSESIIVWRTICVALNPIKYWRIPNCLIILGAFGDELMLL